MASSGRRRSGSEEDYQATIDSIARSAQRVSELEEAKADLSPSDPRARELSKAVEAEADNMERDSEAQHAIVEQSAGDAPPRDN